MTALRGRGRARRWQRYDGSSTTCARPSSTSWGCVTALQRSGRRIELREGLDCRRDLPQLPAAVEIAAYRIATEAMTNAAQPCPRSSRSTSAHRDGREGEIELEIADGGAGVPESFQPGRRPRNRSRARAAQLGRLRSKPRRGAAARDDRPRLPAARSRPRHERRGRTERSFFADDHPLFRHGIGALLRDSPETELVGEAS